MSDDVRLIQLSFPIEIDGKKTKELRVRTRLKIKDLKFLPEVSPDMTEEELKNLKVTPEQIFRLLASLSGVSETVFGEIDVEDIPKLTAEFENFITAMPQITGKS